MSKQYWILWGIISAITLFALPSIGILICLISLIIYPAFKRKKNIQAENIALKERIKNINGETNI